MREKIADYILAQGLDVLPYPVFFKDMEGIYTYVNHSFAKDIMGTLKEEIIGRSDLEIMTNRIQAEKFRRDEKKVIAQGKGKTAEENVALADGREMEMEVIRKPLFDSDGTIMGVTGVFRDITLQNTVKELKQQYKEERIVDKLKKSQFLSNMAYEVKLPMNAMLGILQQMNEEENKSLKHDQAEQLMTYTHFLHMVVNDMLDFHKMELEGIYLDKQPVALQKLVEDCVIPFGVFAEEMGVEIKFLIAPETPEEVLADPVKIRQMLTHLLGNAIKYTREGSIHVEVSLREEEFQRYKLHFMVKDTGIGNSNIVAVVKDMVTAMEGEIKVESKLGVGTTCEVELWVDKDPESKKDDWITHKNYMLRGRKVFVLTKNAMTSHILHTYIKEMGGIPETVTEAGRAFVILTQKEVGHKKKEIVIYDQGNLEMDACHWLARVRESRRVNDLPVILLTNGGEKFEKCDGRNFYDTLRKPIRKTELFTCMYHISMEEKRVDKNRVKKFEVKSESKKYRILIAESEEKNLQLLLPAFTKEYDVIGAKSGEEVLDMVQKNPNLDLLLMNLHLPEKSGMEVFMQLRGDRETSRIPVMFLADLEDEEKEPEILQLGAIDCLIKPLSLPVVVAKVKKEVQKHRGKTGFRNMEGTNDGGSLNFLPGTDRVTGIGDRTAFLDKLQKEQNKAEQVEESLSLLMIDVDHLKKYNEQYGYLEGDHCLKKIALILTSEMRRKDDFAARFDGGTFACVLPHSKLEDAVKIAERIRHAVSVADIIHEGVGKEQIVTVSIGVTSEVPRQGEDMELLINRAETALFEAKQRGKNCVEPFGER